MTTPTATPKEGMRTVRAGEISANGPKAPKLGRRMLESVKGTYRAVRDNVQAMGVTGVLKAGAVGAGCVVTVGACNTGTAVGPMVEETETPAGVCRDLQGRVIRIGTTELALNEEALNEGKTVKLGGEQYVLEAVTVTESGVRCRVKDAEGNHAVVIADGESINEDFFATIGSTWKVVFEDGREIEITLCGVITDAEGNLYGVFKSDGFYWCNSFDTTYNAPVEEYESGFGLETIKRLVHETGQTADEGREEAECRRPSTEVVKEGYEFEDTIMPGTQGYDMHVKLGGQRTEVIELSTAGYILLGTSEAAMDLTPGGEALVSESTGISAKANRVYTMDDGATYLMNVEVKVNGVTFTVESGAAAGTLIEVSYTDEDGVERTAYVRVLSVSGGVAKVDIVKDVFRLEDGGVFIDAEGRTWRVRLDTVISNINNGVDGWTLTRM
ncbi:MAG: hypothetical protein PHQ80_01405 [Candidatus ainarchaeum sp.]|nr:hypothetical protein [Candidatus ainarchaeum sp.]MDD5095907.1 hypothetical protein [Candidatus ainarchaeum sp.]